MAGLESQQASGRLLAALDDMDLRALSRSLSDDLRKRKVTSGARDRRMWRPSLSTPFPA